MGKRRHSSDSLVEASSKVQHAESASLSSAVSHVEDTDDLPFLSCSVGQDRVPAPASFEELVGPVALADSAESAGVTSLSCSSEQVKDPSPTSPKDLVKTKVKIQEDKHPPIILGNKDQLPGDAFGATPEASNNKKKFPQRSNPALNSNFHKIRNNNIRGRPSGKVLPRTTS